jgi:TPR repeat protein
MRVLPIHPNLHTYAFCCGKKICSGCYHHHLAKIEEQGVPLTCAFCRTAAPRSDEELLVQVRERIELNDPYAMHNMAIFCGKGWKGLSVNQAKCISLLRESADIGCSVSQIQLGSFYGTGEMGLEQNEEEALNYFEKAAEGGDIPARHSLACAEYNNGHRAAAMRHFRLSASGGFRDSMDGLIACFEKGWLHHADLARSLQSFYSARDEMKSDDRAQYIAHVKLTGEYEENYEC